MLLIGKRPGTVTISFGPPIAPDRYTQSDDGLALRQMTDEVMFEIRELSGQEYVDTYATKKSEELPAETAVVGGPSTDPATNGHANGNEDGLPERVLERFLDAQAGLERGEQRKR